MPEVREDKIYSALLRFKDTKGVKIGKADITLSLDPKDVHKFDRPDSVLWINISLKIFGQNLKMKIPIPVEGEKRGIEEAMEDLNEFISRRNYPIEIPMLVIAEAGYYKREVKKDFPTRFVITQIPVRRLEEG